MLEGYLVYNNSVEKQNPKNHALLERSSQYVKNTNRHWVIGVVNLITQLTYLSKLNTPPQAGAYISNMPTLLYKLENNKGETALARRSANCFEESVN